MADKKRVLVIDDEEDICLFTKNMLERSGKFYRAPGRVQPAASRDLARGRAERQKVGQRRERSSKHSCRMSKQSLAAATPGSTSTCDGTGVRRPQYVALARLSARISGRGIAIEAGQVWTWTRRERSDGELRDRRAVAAAV